MKSKLSAKAKYEVVQSGVGKKSHLILEEDENDESKPTYLEASEAQDEPTMDTEPTSADEPKSINIPGYLKWFLLFARNGKQNLAGKRINF